MSQNDIEVKIGADSGGLDRGMDAAANVVKTKSSEITEVLRRQAEEAAAIAREQAEGVERAHKESATRLESIGRDLQGRLLGLFSAGAIIGFLRATKQAVTEAESAYRGLEAVANYTGVGIGNAMKAAGEIAADGLMTTAEASKALQNLLSRGYSLDQAVNTLTRLKDAAAFNRQANLEMGEAVVNATEGLKNENSVLVDNAGVTKNVAKMWEEYAREHGKSVTQLTQAEKIQAEYNGVMRETEAQVGNAAKAMDGMQGKQAQLNKSWMDMKVTLGEALVPALAQLAEWGRWVIDNVLVQMVKATKIVGAAFAAVTVDIANVWNAITNWDFSKIGAQMGANAKQFKETVDEIVFSSAGSSFTPSSGAARPRGPQAPAAGPSGASKPTRSRGGSRGDDDGPVDVFDNGSFVTGDKGVASFIREQFDAVNSLQREMVQDAKRAADEVTKIQAKAAEDRKKIDLMWMQEAAQARLQEVDAAQQAAQTQVDLGLMTRAQLLDAEQEFERQRNEIRLAALQERLLMIDPNTDPVTYQQLLVQIEELERQHQANMTQIRAEAAIEQAQPMTNAFASIEQTMASSLQRLFTMQTSFAGFMKSLWQGVTNAIAAEAAKMVAAWVMNKIKMLIFGKTAAMSEIAGHSAKAGAGGVASMAAAPWPLNMTAPAFGAAMAAAAMAYAPAASFAVGAWELPRDMVAQVHKGETIVPKPFAEDFRENGGSFGGNQTINVNVTAMDARGVRDFLIDNKHHVAEALQDYGRGFGRFDS